jgi:hypothetical protein
MPKICLRLAFLKVAFYIGCYALKVIEKIPEK